ncbi:MAG: glycosyltransferase [Anaerolineae bacterium]|nr:glycosyltransferase [Anaerolineae bacterium]
MNRKPYNVLLVDLAKAFGGAEVRVLTQARALKERGMICRVAVLEDSPLHERVEREGLPCEIINLGRGNPALLLTLRDLIARHNYAIVDAHNVQSIFWAHWAAVLAGARGRVATLNSDFGQEYPGAKGRAYEGVLRLNQLVSREYITVTEVLQEKMVRRGYGERSTLIHNAVPVPEAPLVHVDTELRGAWGFAPDDFMLAIIARLKPVKGHRYLLEAVATLADLPQVKLLVVGDGPLRETLEAQVRSLGIEDRVHFTGFVQDIPAVLRGIDALCLSSLSEALPYVLLEAASYARPMIVTRVGGMATLLTDREDAVVVPPRDAPALAEGIRWLATHPQEASQIGLAAYALVQRQFSVERMIEQVLAVYDRAAK